MNDGGGNGASCVGIKVGTDTTKLSDMVVASFGDGRNLVGKDKMFIKDEESESLISMDGVAPIQMVNQSLVY